MIIFHHKLLTREGRVWASWWTYPSFLTVFIHLFIRDVIENVIVVILNTVLVYKLTHSNYI
jgi:hypothetical protein